MLWLIRAVTTAHLVHNTRTHTAIISFMYEFVFRLSYAQNVAFILYVYMVIIAFEGKKVSGFFYLTRKQTEILRIIQYISNANT